MRGFKTITMRLKASQRASLNSAKSNRHSLFILITIDYILCLYSLFLSSIAYTSYLY